MSRVVLSLGLVALLAACGADGAPIAPEPGLTITGSAEMGIASR